MTSSKNSSGAKKERQAAFDSLPPHIKENLSPEEVDLFLHADEWPEPLFKKLEEFILPGE